MDKHAAIDELKARIRAIENEQGLAVAGESSDFASAFIKDKSDNSEKHAIDEDASELAGHSSRKKGVPPSAFSKITTLINASEKSTCELRKRLVRAGYETAEIEEALTRASDCGLVDDMRYASVLVRSRINQGWGREGIERELIRNDIDPTSIEGWPHEFPLSHDEQVSRALEFLQKRPPHARNLRDSAYRKLINRGYASSIASQAAGLWYDKVCE